VKEDSNSSVFKQRLTKYECQCWPVIGKVWKMTAKDDKLL